VGGSVRGQFSGRRVSCLVMRGHCHSIRFRLAAPRRRGDTLWDAVVAAWAPASSPSAANRHHQYTRAPDHEGALCILRALGYLSGPLSVSLQSAAASPRALVRHPARPLGRSARGRRDLHHRLHAPARLPPRPRMAVQEGARGGILRLLRREARDVLRLAAASGHHPGRHPGLVRPVARLFPPGTLWVA